jgi:hypothetical protein
MRSGQHPFSPVAACPWADGNGYPAGIDNGQHSSADGGQSKQARPPEDCRQTFVLIRRNDRSFEIDSRDS